uniref:Uncharacterized protein n=1 Tax=Arundo donax TaxID=35708 RepID=A0A0A8ZTK8_ARUDO
MLLIGLDAAALFSILEKETKFGCPLDQYS